MEHHQGYAPINGDRISLDQTGGSLAHHVHQGQKTQNQVKGNQTATDGNTMAPGKFTQLLKNATQFEHGNIQRLLKKDDVIDLSLTNS